MARDWQPLWKYGGGGSGSGRPASAPRLVTPVRTNPFIYYNDFLAASVGPAAATYGHPEWRCTEIGTVGAGTVGCGFTGTLGRSGWMQVASGATSGDGLMLDLASRGGTTNGQGVPFVATSADMDWVGLWRFRHVNATTARVYGMGWVHAFYVPEGTDWVSDPLTSLATAHALIIHCNTSAYGTSAAGEVTLRWYDRAAGEKLESTLIASPVVNQAYKVEVAVSNPRDSSAYASLKAYVDGVLVVDQELSGLALQAAGDLLRPSMGVVVNAATSRTLQVDTLYQEIAQPSLR